MEERITIPSAYYFKGAACSNIILERGNNNLGITVRNDYNEVMAHCICGSEIAQFILDLQKCKFA